MAIAGGFGLACFVVALISGASLALALALGLGGGVVVGAIYAARRNPERLLPLACIAGAGALFASELMTTFQLSSTGQAFCNIGAAGRHHFAMGVLAIFAVGAVIGAVTTASKPAAIAVGVAGVIALVLFLTIDLPHANNTGTLGGCSASTTGQFFEAKANPQAGFWLEMVGALALALSGVALGTLNPEQLRAIRPGWLGGREPDGDRHSRAARATPLTESEAEPASGGDHDRPATATRRRARARGGRRG
jgi:uncharacterized membrane protein YuzA (DUF378 family)